MKKILLILLISLLAASLCPHSEADTVAETTTSGNLIELSSSAAINPISQANVQTDTASGITGSGITPVSDSTAGALATGSSIVNEESNGPTDESAGTLTSESALPGIEQTSGTSISTLAVKSFTGTITNVKIYKQFDNKMPTNIIEALRYTKYTLPINFVRVTVSKVALRTAPEKKAPYLSMLSKNQRVACDLLVAGSDLSDTANPEWFRVSIPGKKGPLVGFIPTQGATYMGFRISEAAALIEKMGKAPLILGYGYVNNYKNRVGQPQMISGKATDARGIPRDQSAPLYLSGKQNQPAMYLPDGSLFIIRAKSNGWLNIATFPDYNDNYWVPEKFTAYKLSPQKITKLIAVDRKNQNEMTFENTGTKWAIRSRSLATTGASTKYKFETPLGLFMAIVKQSKFNYLTDSQPRVIDGYAPYAIRFSGGAYNHGVPVAYIKGSNGSLKDPGMREILKSLGTVPLSHKCVRNYTSHAKFVYDWASIGSTAVLVFE